MRQEQVELSGKSIIGGINYSLPGKHRRFLGNTVFAPEKLLLARMIRSIGSPAIQVELWDGQEISSPQGEPVARVIIRDRGALLKLVNNIELYFGELYSEQRVEVKGDFLDFLEAVFRVLPLPGQDKIGKKMLTPFFDTRRNTLPGSRRNIHHHYDIGNDFYKLWLDEQMVYTCAYFPSRNTSLEDAQFAKLDHVCRKLG